MGMVEEQWLWKHREKIYGRVLDMSTPKHWHQFIHEKATEVIISDLDQPVVGKMGHSSKVDVLHDFCKPLPATIGLFDTILCMNILEHCEDPLEMVRNLAGALTTKGSLFLLTPYAYTDGHTEQDLWRFCKQGYEWLARKAGLRILHYDRLIDISSQIGAVLNDRIPNVYMCHGIVATKG